MDSTPGRTGEPSGNPTWIARRYLLAIHHLADLSGVATTGALAAHIGRSAASVTIMCKRLHQQGMVKRVPHQGVTLSVRGQAVVEDMQERFTMLETYLVCELGLDRPTAREEARHLAGHLSEQLWQRIAERTPHVPR